MADYGIRTVAARFVDRPEQIDEVVRVLGFPLVAKTAAAGVVHKVDRSSVRTHLTDGEVVRDAVQSIQSACPGGVLLQQQLTGPEVAIGLARDEGFGPLVLAASGGTYLSLWEDQTFLLPPFSVDEAMTAVRSRRTWPLLAGYRGSQPVDVLPLAQLVQRVGQLALDWPPAEELDLNPVIMTAAGPVLRGREAALVGHGSDELSCVRRRARLIRPAASCHSGAAT